MTTNPNPSSFSSSSSSSSSSSPSSSRNAASGMPSQEAPPQNPLLQAPVGLDSSDREMELEPETNKEEFFWNPSKDASPPSTFAFHSANFNVECFSDQVEAAFQSSILQSLESIFSNAEAGRLSEHLHNGTLIVPESEFLEWCSKVSKKAGVRVSDKNGVAFRFLNVNRLLDSVPFGALLDIFKLDSSTPDQVEEDLDSVGDQSQQSSSALSTQYDWRDDFVDVTPEMTSSIKKFVVEQLKKAGDPKQLPAALLHFDLPPPEKPSNQASNQIHGQPPIPVSGGLPNQAIVEVMNREALNLPPNNLPRVFLVGFALSNIMFKDEDFMKSFGEMCRQKHGYIITGMKNIMEISFIVLKRSSALVKIPPPSDDEVEDDINNKQACEAVKDSFEGKTFQDKGGSVCSILTYLSRNYGKIKNGLTEKFNYYSPTACMHQSSGSGKSRLCSELSPFVLPLIISGPNETGKPSESQLLKQFCSRLKSMEDRKYHITVIMSLVHAFITRIYYHSIDVNLNKANIRIDASGKIIDETEEAWNKFFSKAIEADDAMGSSVMGDFDAFLKNHESGEAVGHFRSDPRMSKFASFGVDVEQKLKNLLDGIRQARIRFLMRMLGLSDQDASDMLNWLPHTLTVFDEAQHLSSKLGNFPDLRFINDDGRTLVTDGFRTFRRTSRNSDFYWDYSWSLIISTNGSMANFTPKKTEDPSLRVDELVVLLPPFIYHHSMDVLATEFETVALRDERFLDGVDYIYGWQRLGHVLSCGRPLFYSFVESFLRGDLLKTLCGKNYDISYCPAKANAAFGALFSMLEKKINRGCNFTDLSARGSKIEDLLIYALLSSAVGLYSSPEHIDDKSDLVRNRMAWVTSFNMDSQDVEICYPSEGIFNCFMALVLNKVLHRYLESSLEKGLNILQFFSKPATKKQFASWQVTEILARLLFLFAIYKTPKVPRPRTPVKDENKEGSSQDHVPIDSRVEKMLYPRNLKALLENFARPSRNRKKEERDSGDIGEIANFMEALGGKFNDCMTTFGYFQESLEATRPLEFAKTMLFRGSAKYLPPGHKGADLVLPLVLKNGEYGLVLIQVKGIDENILAVGDPPKESSESAPKPKEENEKKLPSFDEIDRKQRPTATIRGYMDGCTIPGVFGMTERKNMSQDVKDDLKRLREEYRDFPVIRILLNLRDGQPSGVKMFRDGYGPFLCIQTRGEHDFMKISESRFIVKSILTAGKSLDGKLPRLDRAMRDSPQPHSPYLTDRPFNPAYLGILQDNDLDIFSGRYLDIVSKSDLQKEVPLNDPTEDAEGSSNSAVDEFPSGSMSERILDALRRRPSYYFTNIDEMYRKIGKP